MLCGSGGCFEPPYFFLATFRPSSEPRKKLPKPSSGLALVDLEMISAAAPSPKMQEWSQTLSFRWGRKNEVMELAPTTRTFLACPAMIMERPRASPFRVPQQPEERVKAGVSMEAPSRP